MKWSPEFFVTFEDVATMNETLTYTQVKGTMGSTQTMRRTLTGPGLMKRYKTDTRKNTPELRGMLNKVQHLVKMEE